MWRWVGLVALSFAAAFWLCGTYPLQPAGQGDPESAAGINAITTASFDPAHPELALPADFAAVMGYRPRAASGPDDFPILIKPNGDCSSFTGRTEYDFTTVCKEHDLAYDVIRYAQRVGSPLDAGARQAADAMFDRELHGRCDQLGVSGFDWAMCHSYAEGFAQVVKLNSWRQGYRSPEHESPWRWTAMLLLAGGFITVPLGWRLLRRRAAAAPFAPAGFLLTVPPRSGRSARTTRPDPQPPIRTTAQADQFNADSDSQTSQSRA